MSAAPHSAPPQDSVSERHQFAIHRLAAMDHTDRARAVRETALALAEAMPVARVSAWTYDASRSAIHCAGLVADGTYTTERLVLEASQYPRYFEALRGARLIAASDARSDRRTSEFTDGYLVPLGITAMLDAAIEVGDQPIGVLCVEHVGGPRSWTEAECDLISSAAALLSVSFALEREKSLQEQLRHSQKMEAVGLLAGGVAHDVNNILSVILGEAELLDDARSDAQAHAEGLRAIRAAADQAARLAQKLLTFSRQRPLELRQVDLGAVVADFERMGRRALGETIDFRVHRPEEPLAILGDADMLEQVLLNLTMNARQAMPDGGEFTIAVDVAPAGTASPDITATHQGPLVRLTVTDSGVGMDEAVLQRIWEPFFTTRALGSGLGLSIVHGAVRQMRGALSVQSVPGRGSTFTFLFPQVLARPVSTPPEGQPTMATLRGRVLLAEDEPQVRAVLATLLRRAGLTVTEAVDGEDALAVFARQPEAIDVVLSDVAMPRMDGVTAFRRMREIRPDLPCLFVTGYAPSAAGLESLIAEGSAVRGLTKPASREVLMAELAALLNPVSEPS